MNEFLKSPNTDFAAVRDGRTPLPFYIDIDLTTARSIAAGNALVLNISGNSFYIDADTTNCGFAIVHFQDTTLGPASSPFFVSPGFIASVSFTQLLIENAAQSAKRLRIFYGVDINFQAGVNAQISISGSVQSENYSFQQTRNQSNYYCGLVGGLQAGLPTYLSIGNNGATKNIELKSLTLSLSVASQITVRKASQSTYATLSLAGSGYNGTGYGVNSDIGGPVSSHGFMGWNTTATYLPGTSECMFAAYVPALVEKTFDFTNCPIRLGPNESIWILPDGLNNNMRAYATWAEV